MVALSILTTIAAATCSTFATASAAPRKEPPQGQQGRGAWDYVNAKSCPGGKVDEGKVGNKGRWYLYYSPSGGGTNCLYVVNTTGKRQQMVALIEDSTHRVTHYALDQGPYSQWAGSVRLGNMAGKCVDVSVAVGTASTHRGPFHCGR